MHLCNLYLAVNFKGLPLLSVYISKTSSCTIKGTARSDDKANILPNCVRAYVSKGCARACVFFLSYQTRSYFGPNRFGF